VLSNSAPIDPALHEMAVRLAIRCRRIVQACLREEEWPDADLEFYQIIRDGLLEFGSAQHGKSGDAAGEELR
jgi:hypothetical protein